MCSAGLPSLCDARRGPRSSKRSQPSPEQADDLGKYAAIIVDDVPGFTPAVRCAVAGWSELVLRILGQRTSQGASQASRAA